MIPLSTRRLSGKDHEFFPGLSMWRLRAKAQSILLGMVVMMMLFIVWKAASSAKGAISNQSKSDYGLKSSKINNLENVNELMSITQSALHLNKQKSIESSILAGDNLAALDHGNDVVPDARNAVSTKKLLNNIPQSDNKLRSNGSIRETEYGSKNSTPIFRGHRIVHLDLKGAPPKVSYYEEIFPLIKDLGGTGVLIEYEDMFPYRYNELSARNAYTKNDIANIIKLATDNNLIVIPLIQTFGHLEFMLKLKKYKHLREVPRHPQVVCPTNNGSLTLIKEMIDDIVELHPTSNYIHIGSDEVFYLGECSKCIDIMKQKKWNKRDLFLHHMTSVAKYIKEKHVGVSVLVWDDEFRRMSVDELLRSNVGKLVEPVVWKYMPDIPSEITSALSDTYPAVFPAVWIASAFKGATSPNSYVTDIDYHLTNHHAWMRIVTSLSNTIHFKGIFLTGWQRYDHFAVLCELLPVGFPSLAVNLGYLSSPKLPDYIWPCPKAEKVLKCDSLKGLKKLGSPVRCSFPGSQMFEAAGALYSLNERFNIMIEGSNYRGWFSEYNIEMMFSSPSHVEEALTELGRIKMELDYIKRDSQKAMSEIYDSSVYTEWAATFIKPLEEKLNRMWQAKEKLLSKDDWPRRPLTRLENNLKYTDDGL